MKWYLEIVQDFDGTYSAELMMGGTDEEGSYHEPCRVKDLPEYVDYRALSKAILEKTGIRIPRRKDLNFIHLFRKKYAYVDATHEGKIRIISDEDALHDSWKPDFS